ncbi:MAG: hypothetical protein GX868_02380 [Actinobacteria bacterium]|nr:hypothetical protein [Actinomycetota bacterium]
MATGIEPPSGRLRRLAEELDEIGLTFDLHSADDRVVIDEIDYGLRPAIHERRIPTYGSLVLPSADAAHWKAGTGLRITTRALDKLALGDARRFADGSSSWLVRRRDRGLQLAVFDRPASSERDIVVMVDAFQAAIVQRHSSGVVRLATERGVARWDGLAWHREPLVTRWIDAMAAWEGSARERVFAKVLAFAVHDLGARGIGALLIVQNADDETPNFEQRMAEPPPLDVGNPLDLTPLRHVLSQIDGAAVFDRNGVLRHLGVRLVASPEAVADVDGHRGMRHTSGRRYSFDQDGSVVIVVSEDGPVTVMKNGTILGRTDAQA